MISRENLDLFYCACRCGCGSDSGSGSGRGWRLKVVVDPFRYHMEFRKKKLVKEQICHKLICFEGEAKETKVRSVVKWWLKCISMIIGIESSITMHIYDYN